MTVDATPYRSTSCVLLSRHATKDGASRLSSVLQLPGKRFLLDREFGLVDVSCRKLTGEWRFQLVTGRVWRGSAFGGVKGRTELPGIVEGQGQAHLHATSLSSISSVVDYLQGNVKVDEYVTHEFKFADINEGFDAMHVRPHCFCLGASALRRLSRPAIASVLSLTCRELKDVL